MPLDVVKNVVEEILRKRSPGGPKSESMDWIHLTQAGLCAEGLGTNGLQAFPTVFRVF